MKRSFAAVVAIALLVSTAYARKHAAPPQTVASAFASQRSNVVVEDHGHVLSTLRDDTKGSRHQRFLVRVDSGTTVLIAHNIDIAARIEPLHRGDAIAFRGEYVWNNKGGLVHWTHHDPAARHAAGWVRVNGKTFE